MIEQINQIARMWWVWMWPMFWQVGVVVVLVWVVDLIIRRRVWPQVRYALWGLILLKLILPPWLASPTSVTSELAPLATEAVRYSFFTDEPAVGPPSRQPGPAVTTDVEGLIVRPPVTYDVRMGPGPQMPARDAAVVADSPEASHVAEEKGPRLGWRSWAMLVWLMGVVTLAGWLVLRFRRLRRRHAKKGRSELPARFEQLLAEAAAKLRLRRLPKVVLSREVVSPAVFGVFRPVLLMPAGEVNRLCRRELEHVLLHELAHIKRGDLKVHAFYMVLQIVYWFNPLLWLVRRQLQHLRELCCDATVARILREETTGYRETILQTARRLLTRPAEPGMGLLGLFEDSARLVTRLKWLEKKTWKHRGLRIATVFIIVAVMAACVLPMAKEEEAPSVNDLPVVRTSRTREGREGTEFRMSTKTKDGIYMTSQAEPMTLSFRITGELKPGDGKELEVPLVTIPADAQILKEEHKQLKEATLKLLKTSGDFVEPLYVRSRFDKDIVSVAFMFRGPEDPQRRIKLTVRAVDSDRNTLGMLVRQCRDQRIIAKNPPVILSDRPLMSRVNMEELHLDEGLLEKAARIEVRFEELARAKEGRQFGDIEEAFELYRRIEISREVEASSEEEFKVENIIFNESGGKLYAKLDFEWTIHGALGRTLKHRLMLELLNSAGEVVGRTETVFSNKDGVILRYGKRDISRASGEMYVALGNWSQVKEAARFLLKIKAAPQDAAVSEPQVSLCSIEVKIVNAQGRAVDDDYSLDLWRRQLPGDQTGDEGQIRGRTGRWYNSWKKADWIQSIKRLSKWERLYPGEYIVTADHASGEVGEGWKRDPTPTGISDVIYLDGVERKDAIAAVRLEGDAPLTIRFVDSQTLEPVGEASHWLYRDDGRMLGNGGHADGNGILRYRSLNAGTYRLESRGKGPGMAKRKEYVPLEEPVKIEVIKGQENEVTVRLDPNELTEAQIKKRWPWSVTGTVTDEQGRPMEGVRVQVAAGWGTLGRSDEDVTNADGRYTLRFIAGGFVMAERKGAWYAAIVSAFKDGHYEANLCSQGDLAMAYEPIDPNARGKEWRYQGVVLPNEPYEVNFVMVRAARIKGRLIDGQGSPIGGKGLWLAGEGLYPASSVLASFETDADGRFAVDSVARQICWLTYRGGRRKEVTTVPIDFSEPVEYEVVLVYEAPEYGSPNLKVEKAEPRVSDEPGATVEIEEAGSGAPRAGTDSGQMRARGEEILRRMREVNRYWLVGPAAEVKNYAYDFVVIGQKREKIEISDPREVFRDFRQGIGYHSLVHRVVCEEGDYAITDVAEDEETIRLDFAFEDPIKIIARHEVAFGCNGCFVVFPKKASLWLDAAKMVPVQVKAEDVEERFSEYASAADGCYVPLRIEIEHEDSSFDWRFRLHEPGLWLFEEGRYGEEGKEPAPAALVEKVRVNDASITETKVPSFGTDRWPTVLSVEQGRSEQGAQQMILTTRTRKDVTVRAVAEPGRMIFETVGTLPVKDGKRPSIELLSAPDVADLRSEKRKELREATVQLLAAGGRFVKPGYFHLGCGEATGQCDVRFLFMGPETVERRIKVTVELRDANGVSLATMTRQCADGRIYARANRERDRSGSRREEMNLEQFYFDPKLADRIEQVAVTFEQMPAWAKVVEDALPAWPAWEIIQCDHRPTVSVGRHKGYRLLLRQGHKVYDSAATQVLTVPQPGDNFITEHSYIDLVLIPSDRGLAASIKDKIPWKDVEQKELAKPVYMGLGMGFAWFVRTAVHHQEDLRRELDLEGGEDRIQLLVDGIYAETKDRVASGQVQLPWLLQYFGREAIPYIEAAIKKNPHNYRGHEYAAFTLGHVPSEGSTSILRGLYASQDSRVRRAAAEALLRRPYRKSAKKEYLDMLGQQIPVLGEAAEVCVEFRWKEAIPLLEEILANPHSWQMFPAALKARRQLQGRAVPEYVENILGLWTGTARADPQWLVQIKRTILDSSDGEAAAISAVYLALYGSKGPAEQVNETGREIFTSLPPEATKGLLENLTLHLKDQVKYDNHRFMKLLDAMNEREHVSAGDGQGADKNPASESEDRAVDVQLRCNKDEYICGEPILLKTSALTYSAMEYTRRMPSYAWMPPDMDMGFAMDIACGEGDFVNIMSIEAKLRLGVSTVPLQYEWFVDRHQLPRPLPVGKVSTRLDMLIIPKPGDYKLRAVLKEPDGTAYVSGPIQV